MTVGTATFGLQLEVAADVVDARWRHVCMVLGRLVQEGVNLGWLNVGVEWFIVTLTCFLLWEIALDTASSCALFRIHLELDHLPGSHVFFHHSACFST